MKERSFKGGEVLVQDTPTVRGAGKPRLHLDVYSSAQPPEEPIGRIVPHQTPTMAILSAQLLLRAITLFHFTLSYYLFTSPSTIASQNLVYVLGAAMDIPEPPVSLSTPSPASTLAALFLALLALSDMTSSGLPEEVGSHYWSNQAPIRLAFFFAVTGYVYAGKPGGVWGGKAGMQWEVLCNSVVFTWGFLEMLWWFWVSLDVSLLGLFRTSADSAVDICDVKG